MPSYKQDLVSVVIPTYNQVDFIKETLDSVLQQTYSKLEIIVADDASNDGTQEIISEYAAKDNRIKPLLSKKNQGIPANFNKAFDAVSGEFIAFLGGDDVMKENKIELQLNVLNKDNSIGLVYSDMEIFESISNKRIKLKSEDGIYYQPLAWCLKVDWFLSKKTGILPSSCLARSDYYLQARYDKRFKLKHEMFFTLEDYYKNPTMKWVYLDKVLGRYRIHDSNFSQSKESKDIIVQDTFLVSDLCIKKFPESTGSVHQHLKSFTFHQLLMNNIDQTFEKRFNEIYKSFNSIEKLHFKLSSLFKKVGLLKYYLKFASLISKAS